MEINFNLNPKLKEEKEYILSTIFEDILGFKCNYNYDLKFVDYQIYFSEDKKIIISDIFFSERKSLVWKDFKQPTSSFSQKINLNKSHDLIGFYGDDKIHFSQKGVFLKNDIIGTSFIFLSRIEELNKNFDSFGRFMYKSSISHRFKIINRPIINEYIELIKDLILIINPESTFKKNNFEILLTHDIDTIKKWTLKKFIKETIFSFEKKSFLRNFFNFFGSMIDYKSDPYFNFEKILAISDKHNIKSVFLFMALKRNEFDFRYPLKKVKSFLEKLSTNNNHSFGLHLSRLSYNNPVNASKEVERFKSLTKMKIKYNRQHYLMFDVNSTWKILDEHDITYDLSLGYPEMPGFRCGICYPFHTFDIINKKKLDLVEIPLIIMDVTLFDYLKDKKFKDDLNEIINNVKRYNGVLNILWHNDNYDEPVFKKNKDLFYNIINN